jgi:endonuclease/exonuclease/phosphatase family metal-dependent hydrolase
MTTLRIATFNLENLFTRPTAMNQKTDAAGRKALEDHATANAIIAKAAYTAADKKKLVTLSEKYGWHLASQPANALVYLNKVRGQLFKKPKNGPLEVVANGAGDWTGWFDLKRDDIAWKATLNTGRVIKEVNPDILVTVEVENRPTLERFNTQVLGSQFQTAYPHVMLIDGNDARGIDVGVLSRFPIESVRSHVDDLNPNGEKTFSRDCPEYEIVLPQGKRLVLLPNHFKSKRNGDDAQSKEKRRLQANRSHAIAVAALARSPYMLLAGDLNDTPDSAPLKALFTDGFTDIQEHPDYPTDRPGTFGTGLAPGKIDYLLSSPQLWAGVTASGIERRGSYHPNLWQPFDTVKGEADNASDHFCVWMDVTI